ncbi:MAG: SulP family inorganic anion transporter [Nitriliruptoraceae bacterium]|nr:SulP family inorganic anion transporter [Nitriliruptoraceae bacterium]
MTKAPWFRVPDLPVRTWASGYQRAWWSGDVQAGVIVTALVVPQALGYAAIAGVPVQVGLYAVPLALLVYTILGSSPHLSVGPVSTVSVVSGSIVAAQAGDDPQRAIALTLALALLSGLVLVVAGLLRTGWVAEFLSKPIVTGFVFGLALVIILAEFPRLLGLPGTSGTTLRRLIELARSLPAVDPLTATIGLGGLVVLFVGGSVARRIPWGLVLVVVTLVITDRFALAERGVEVVGEVPRGLPAPGLPMLTTADLAALALPAIGLALVGLAETLSAARLFAATGGYRIDTDQEFVATGVANIASGLFGGLGVAGSLSKTAAAVRSGANSQATSVIAALLTVAVLVLFAPALGSLPRAVLAAVVIHAVWGLLDVASLRRYAGIRRNDAVAGLGALVGVVVFGTLPGLAIAVGLSLLGLVYRSSRVEVEELGNLPGEKAAWGALRRHRSTQTVAGLMILRLDSPLFWVNAAMVEERVIELIDADPEVRAVVLNLEATDQLDSTSTDVLRKLLVRLHRRDIDLYLVRVHYRTRGVLKRAGLRDAIGDDHLWRTISQGVLRARKDHGLAKPGRPLPDDARPLRPQPR